MLANKAITISTDIPSLCAEKLINGQADLGLIPVAALDKLPHSRIISNYCIGASGKVETVLLLSEQPLNKINSILLDYQSRSSVILVQILAKHFWNIKADFVHAGKNYENKISGKTAGLIIGDRTFKLPKKFPYRYDLSAEWQKMTGLPFVFAAWTANNKLPETFISNFNSALIYGLRNIPDALKYFSGKLPVSLHRAEQYLTNNISYFLDSEKRKALDHFRELAKTITL